ncbi:hypothetical protein WISP_75822 [Willisornis vidua]|uniref:Reverse transcriptase domain-containing protein n=1 Tax=Willisornis vidua TaxID=1566151 RepID=A0ABQ9D688_9PASS|nr:hypothetical protein WISP_75822 [Willisornis vidua]
MELLPALHLPPPTCFHLCPNPWLLLDRRTTNDRRDQAPTTSHDLPGQAGRDKKHSPPCYVEDTCGILVASLDTMVAGEAMGQTITVFGITQITSSFGTTSLHQLKHTKITSCRDYTMNLWQSNTSRLIMNHAVLDNRPSHNELEVSESTYKKDKRNDPGNYKPVSLTSVPGMVMKQVILSSFMWHMESNQAIRSSQQGFMKGKFCLANLIFFYGNVTPLVDEGKSMVIVYLNLSNI